MNFSQVKQLNSNRVSTPQARNPPRSRAALKVQAAKAISPDDVADIPKRNLLNLVTYGALGLNVLTLGGPYAYSFFPKLPPAGAGTVAKDKAGNDIYADKWLATHKANDKTLVEGLKGDVYYLLVKEGDQLESFSLNAVCTHLGCVVPWNSAENKFKCPCHGSQYNTQGKVIRGPAPLSLALAETNINENGSIGLKPWKDTDFRTGQAPWWK